MNTKGIKLAAALAAIGVILGAYGAHGLKELVKNPELVASWETGVKYQMYHAFAIAIVAIMQSKLINNFLSSAIVLFAIGTVLFSGSIYTLVLLKGTANIGIGGLGVITPIGGLLLVLAWIMVFLGAKTTKQ